MSQKRYSLVFEELNVFRQDLQSYPLPKSLNNLLRIALVDEVVPLDEGIKLFDCEGREIEVNEVEAFDIADEDIDKTVETVKKAGDEDIVQEIMQNLTEKVVKTE